MSERNSIMNAKIELNIPKDGTWHKYIVGTNAQDTKVILAEPIQDCAYHKDIVQKYKEPLQKVRGGYVRYEKGQYIFDGSSEGYGQADHTKVSKLVNGSDIKSRIANKYVCLERRLKDDISDLQNDCGLDIYTPRKNLMSKASTTTFFTSFALSGVLYAIKGFEQAPITPVESDFLVLGPLAAYAAGTMVEPLINHKEKKDPTDDVCTAVLGIPVLGLCLSAAYAAGYVMRELTK